MPTHITLEGEEVKPSCGMASFGLALLMTDPTTKHKLTEDNFPTMAYENIHEAHWEEEKEYRYYRKN